MADVNIAAQKRAAKHHTGFGKPRRWVQTVFVSENERFDGFNGSDQAIHNLAIALMQVAAVDLVLVIDGKANRANVKAADILSEYRRDDTGDGSQTVVTVEEIANDCKN